MDKKLKVNRRYYVCDYGCDVYEDVKIININHIDNTIIYLRDNGERITFSGQGTFYEVGELS